MKTSPSLRTRAVLALVLMVGFYALALGIVGGLLYAAAFGLTYGSLNGLKLAVGCAVSAFVVAKAVMPRRETFEAPGPRLSREDCPALFDAIEDLARMTGQEVPHDVYLVNDVNAFVTRRGGFMGFGSTPVMGIGLPLLHALNTEEARGVIAHEFGHFVGGDTRLGPVIYTTRAAIGRTVASLTEGRSWLSKPFLWYGKLFLRITQAISRRQEFQADQVGARVTSAAAMSSALQKTESAGLAFNSFWADECVPVLESGFRPSIHQGFAHFVSNEKLSAALDEALSSAMQDRKADPYDTHPPLPERIDALAAPAGAAPTDAPPAATWLRDIDALELRLLTFLAGPDQAARLTAIAWSDTAREVFAPAWQRRADELDALVGNLTVGDLGDFAAGDQLRAFGRMALGPLELEDPYSPEWDDTFSRSAINSLGACLAAALLADGWIPYAPLAESPYLEKADRRLAPWREIEKLATGTLTPEAWRPLTDDHAITTLPLCPTAPPPPKAKQTDFYDLA